MNNAPIIVWFRQDLRLTDNPAFYEAVKTGAKIIPIYILDDVNAGQWVMGKASRVWLHHSLNALSDSLDGNLACFSGDALPILKALTKATKARGLYWNRCYEPWRMERDKIIKDVMMEDNLDVQSFNASLLYEPWTVKKDDGTPYRVFTPYFRRGCVGRGEPAKPLPAPKDITFAKSPEKAISIDALKLLPTKIRWDTKMEEFWAIGEKGAHKRLKDFLKDGLDDYKEGRNFPSQDNVSRLSPHLHFGEMSPRTAWYAIRKAMENTKLDKDGDCYLSELGWREFSYSLLYFNHKLPEIPLQKRFTEFPWKNNKTHLRKWQTGQTGYPIVDAGMRQLWQTGWMHNRVRMIVGSFLVKDLMLHWIEGEKWFWDCLVDADLASNAASWQWIAGCGADAAPYFRIFNPVSQGEKFDPDGNYIRRFCPELTKLPNEWIHKPWEAPPLLLKEAGVILGKTYPHPVVDHKQARLDALQAFKITKNEV